MYLSLNRLIASRANIPTISVSCVYDNNRNYKGCICEIATVMGKRSRNRDNMTAAGMVEIADLNTVSEEKLVQGEKQSIRKKNKNKVNRDQDNYVMDTSKKMKIDTDQGLTTECKNSDNNEENDTQLSIKKDIKNKKKRRKNDVDEENTTDNSSTLLSKPNEIPIKIKFGEDGEPDFDILKNKKEKSYLNDEEREIQDDDIDQFCNDVNDEDNKQYESWILLLEQKLGSDECNSSNKKNRKRKKDKNKSTA